VGYASIAGEVGGTPLGEVPVPALHEINQDPEFQAQTITHDDFEMCWIDAIQKD